MVDFHAAIYCMVFDQHHRLSVREMNPMVSPLHPYKFYCSVCRFDEGHNLLSERLYAVVPERLQHSLLRSKLLKLQLFSFQLATWWFSRLAP